MDRQDLTPERWQELLSLELACPVRVVYTRARRTPIQVRPVRHERGPERRRAPSGLEVRMHAMFAGAPPDVHRAVASWIRSGKRAPRACAALDDWIAARLETLPRRPHGRVRAKGRRHDLDAMMRELRANELALEFPTEESLPRASWGKRGASRTRFSLRLGSYDPDLGLVRVHAVLDQEQVPAWFVRYVLFHELLHVVYPPRRGAGGKWIHHCREFRKRERRYAEYGRALEWEAANIQGLIRSARRGVEFVAVEAATPEETRSDGARVNPCATAVTALPAVIRVLQRLLFPA